MMTETDAARLKAEAIHLASALHTVVSESEEAETVRIAMAALLATQTGRDYIEANPLRY
jgi:hypothetical protein